MLEELISLVPQQYWPVIGVWFFRVLLGLCLAYLFLLFVRWVDKRDGRVNWGWVGVAIDTVHYILQWCLVFVEMLPIQIPFVKGFQRMRELLRSPNQEKIFQLGDDS